MSKRGAAAGATGATGERVFTSEAGWNPTWQRHVAAYSLCEPFLPPGPVLDLGCGVGHSFKLLAPRASVGVDLDASALAGQDRRTIQADMRDVPLSDASFESILSVHSLEHVPDPERVLSEVGRLLESGGVAVFVTPNRLTFGRPEEIIDPYHWHEFDANELRALIRREHSLMEPELHGIMGSVHYLEIVADQRRKLDALLRRDALRLRRAFPRRMRQRLYDRMLARQRALPTAHHATITVNDFSLGADLESALDLVAVTRRAVR